MCLQLFVVADGTPLDYAKHYWGIYVGLEKIEQVRAPCLQETEAKLGRINEPVVT